MNNLINLISLFSKQSVLVIGDIMIDKFVWGEVNRISPEAPVPVVEVKKETEMLGGAGNVANNLASYNAKSYIVGAIGDDIAGQSLMEQLKSKNINSDYIIRDSNRPTIVKTRIIAASQQVVRFDKEVKGHFSNNTQLKIVQNIESLIPRMNAVIISDYGKGIVSPMLLKRTIELCKKYKIPIAVDPKVENFTKYKGVTTITPNTKEAIEGMGAVNINTDKDLADLGKKILSFLKTKSVLITRSEKGMMLICHKNQIINIPTRAKEVYDVTGAGDTVISTMTLALAANADLISAAEIANFAAGIVVAKIGTATASPQELKNTIAEFYKK
ncbi:MAG: D-glycero-beta-D-manno-heptose-7-phosphate kinase [Elusimicrobiota bacterium]|jgi:D-beta-D-heptose 7-phosphate kinase/D-beta-D-heptose 1-phosphate adenosyltransferase|nr:D-glycero-beta-D-manno-heptose-7-phosphate kinase [Elusimicrobiota bacterium]